MCHHDVESLKADCMRNIQGLSLLLVILIGKGKLKISVVKVTELMAYFWSNLIIFIFGNVKLTAYNDLSGKRWSMSVTVLCWTPIRLT